MTHAEYLLQQQERAKNEVALQDALDKAIKDARQMTQEAERLLDKMGAPKEKKP